MTTEKEVEQSGDGNPESINSDPVVEKGVQMEIDKPRVDKEEVGKDKSDGEAKKVDDAGQNEELENDEQEKKLLHSLPDVSTDGGQESHLEASHGQRSDENIDFSVDAVENGKVLQAGNIPSNVDYSDGSVISTQQGILHDEKESMKPNIEEDVGVKLDISESLHSQGVGDEINCRTQTGESPSTQNSDSSPSKIEQRKEEKKDGTETDEDPTVVEKRSNLLMFDTDTSGGGDSGTEIEQAAFIMELQKFQKERGLDFKSPKFYGEPLNLLKLWRAVRKLGGYDKVTTCKYWRPVGESFNPPKTCTTISWTFRIFYEKALLDYERYRGSADGTCLPAPPVPMVEENQAPGSGRARRDAAARAMQGWHPQRDNGEVNDPIDKDKNSGSLNKKEKPLKSLDSILKRKNTSSTDDAVKSVQVKVPKIQSDATVIDIGSPADWVKINVRATRDCYEVYALVPGLLREEVRVQSDPAGRLVISGEPENPDDPWNVTPFKKVVSLPSRIDPHQTSAVVTLHGQLFVRVPFEHYD